jgi:hypothetical protein
MVNDSSAVFIFGREIKARTGENRSSQRYQKGGVNMGRTPQQIGRASKQKGYRVELQFAKLIGGKRVYKSGALGKLGSELVGDVEGLGMKWEVKVRANGFKRFYSWLEEWDAVCLRTSGEETLVLMALDTFVEALLKPVDVSIIEKPGPFKQVRKWLQVPFIKGLALKADRQPWLVAMELREFEKRRATV